MPRPRAITEDVEKLLLQALEAGSPIRLACQYAGIGHETFYAELKRNPDISDRVSRARAKAAIRNLALIQQAAPTDWRAAKEALLLSFPEYFGKQRVEVSGPDGEPVATKTTLEIDPDHIAAALRALVESGGGQAPADSSEPVHPAPADP
jgi:hypothetical protein